MKEVILLSTPIAGSFLKDVMRAFYGKISDLLRIFRRVLFIQRGS